MEMDEHIDSLLRFSYFSVMTTLDSFVLFVVVLFISFASVNILSTKISINTKMRKLLPAHHMLLGCLGNYEFWKTPCIAIINI